MASKEKVDIKRSDQFQEVDEELSRAMADLDSTIERVNALLHPESEEGDLLAAEPGQPDGGAEKPDTPAEAVDASAAEPESETTAKKTDAP